MAGHDYSTNCGAYCVIVPFEYLLLRCVVNPRILSFGKEQDYEAQPIWDPIFVKSVRLGSFIPSSIIFRMTKYGSSLQAEGCLSFPRSMICVVL